MGYAAEWPRSLTNLVTNGTALVVPATNNAKCYGVPSDKGVTSRRRDPSISGDIFTNEEQSVPGELQEDRWGLVIVRALGVQRTTTGDEGTNNWVLIRR